mmetsp:Transcript_18164/g.22311  ORF Transcript_18164/g.22311 Transcript_18164/m.22311 type:complete len:230 (-) Transcript_18164:21-710(-)
MDINNIDINAMLNNSKKKHKINDDNISLSGLLTPDNISLRKKNQNIMDMSNNNNGNSIHNNGTDSSISQSSTVSKELYQVLKQKQSNNIRNPNTKFGSNVIYDIPSNNNNNNNNNNANDNEPGGLSIGVTTDVTEFSSYIPFDPDIMHECEIKCNAEHRYRMNLIRPALKAVIKSTETRINLNDIGVLSIQYIIDPENNAGSWTKYIIIPLSSENDTESNDGNASFLQL